MWFKKETAHGDAPTSHAFSMADVLANVTGDDTERAPEAHTQVDRLQAELADKITACDYRDADLTKRIDFLVEERRQVRVVRAAHMAARAAACEPRTPISEGLLAAELDIDYTDHEAYP